MVASSKPVNSALNPAWRDTAVHMIVKTSWSTNLTQERVDALHDDATNRTGRAMRQLSPDSGCYVNEVRLYPVLIPKEPGPNLQYSAINMSLIGSGPCMDRITLAFVPSRRSMIPTICFGAGNALEARIGHTLPIVVACVAEQPRTHGPTMLTSKCSRRCFGRTA
jgi:hypothetical protein